MIPGSDHPDTLSSMNNLANLYYSQGRYNKAEALYKECLLKRKTILGSDHPDTLSSMSNLANLYYSQGRYNEAEALYKECLAKRKTILGSDHPDTLSSMNNLAGLYRSQGRYNEAEALNKEFLGKCESMLGSDHPNTLSRLQDNIHPETQTPTNPPDDQPPNSRLQDNIPPETQTPTNQIALSRSQGNVTVGNNHGYLSSLLCFCLKSKQPPVNANDNPEDEENEKEKISFCSKFFTCFKKDKMKILKAQFKNMARENAINSIPDFKSTKNFSQDSLETRIQIIEDNDQVTRIDSQVRYFEIASRLGKSIYKNKNVYKDENSKLQSEASNIQSLLGHKKFHSLNIWDDFKASENFINNKVMKLRRHSKYPTLEGLKLLKTAWDYVDITNFDATEYRRICYLFTILELLLVLAITVLAIIPAILSQSDFSEAKKSRNFRWLSSAINVIKSPLCCLL